MFSRKSVYTSLFKDSSKKCGLIIWLPYQTSETKGIKKEQYSRILYRPIMHFVPIYLSIITEISLIEK